MSFPAVRRWLEDHTGLEPSLLEGAGFDTHVGERVASAGGGSEAGYVAVLDRSAAEVDRLTSGIAVPETWFFRYPRSFEVLAEFLSRRLASGAASLRVCSIGCATGQEVYCIAMAALHAGWAPERVSIEGIDRSPRALRTAESAAYGVSSIRSEIPAWAAGYLRIDGDVIRIDPVVRGMVRFSAGDALDPGVLAGPPCDAIFCRNLLIYLSAAARIRVVESLCEALAPGGLLFVGHAEQVIRSSAPLRIIPVPHAFALERIDQRCDPMAPGESPLRSMPTVRVVPRRGRPEEAPRARQAVAPPPEVPAAEPPASLDDASDLADSGRTADAEAMVRSVITRAGPSARALELLGMIRMAANDEAAAKKLFEQAVYLEPGRAASLLQLAIISERQGNAGAAGRLWDRSRRASGEKERRP